MKKRRWICITTVLLCTLLIPEPVYAWNPVKWFYCDVDQEKIPENAVYVDLLLPISTEDEGYISYNESNGEKYGITQDSEIVEYCEEGYRSYTFHIVDANSSMRPYWWYEFSVEKEVHEQNKELLAAFEEDCWTEEGSDLVEYLGIIEYKSEKEEALKQLEEVLGVGAEDGFHGYAIEYNEGSDRKFNYDYCCKKYKHAKMAYLDETGNVLVVTSETDIYRRTLAGFSLDLSLSGTELTSEFSYNPTPRVLLGIASVYLPIVAGVIIGIAYFVKKQKRKRDHG